jgi:hypothetical protein
MTRKSTETPEQYNERIRKRDEEDIRSILKTEYGKRFIWRFLGRCGTFHQSIVFGSPDASAFNEGRRSIGNTLLAQVLEIKPEAYVEMTKMSKGDERERNMVQAANTEES